MKIEKGKKYRVKTFVKRPTHWNEEGEMDHWMGKVVTIEDNGFQATIKIVEDDRPENQGLSTEWYWREEDFEEINEPYDTIVSRFNRRFFQP